MRDIAATTNSVGTWPAVTAKNATTTTAKDGTRLEANWLTDVWGIIQHAMAKTSTTPNGSPETATASQFWSAAQKMLGCGPGTLVWTAFTTGTIPAGVRLLPLIGQRVAVDSYPELVSAVQCREDYNATADSFYRATAITGGTRSVSGAWLQLPDARARFLQGTAPNYDMGDYEAESIRAHSHDGLENDDYSGIGSNFGATLMLAGTGIQRVVPILQSAEDLRIKTSNTGTNIGTKTVPQNVKFLLCIRY
jgi:hypothetical protein